MQIGCGTSVPLCQIAATGRLRQVVVPATGRPGCGGRHCAPLGVISKPWHASRDPTALGSAAHNAREPARPRGRGHPRPCAALPPSVADALSAAASQPSWDFVCFLLAASGAFLWVKVFDMLAHSGVLEQKLSRKLVHATAGPLFVVTWLLFSADPNARFFAAAVPFLNFLRLSLVGTGVVSDPGLVASVSRKGDRTELLAGPLAYVIALISVTVLCWRREPAGLVAVAMMCGGDGLADIVGRRLGAGNALPWNSAKSWAGSLAMFGGGLSMAMGFIHVFSGMGYLPCYQPALLLPYTALICAVCTLVESLPINQWVDDNVSVPAVAAGLAAVLLPACSVAAVGVGGAALVAAAGGGGGGGVALVQ